MRTRKIRFAIAGFSALIAALLSPINSAHAAFQSSGLIANWTGASLSGSPTTWVDSVNSNTLNLANTTYNSANGGTLAFNGSSSGAVASASITSFTSSTTSMFFWINVSDLSATRIIQETARSPSTTVNEEQFQVSQTTGKLYYWDYNGTSYGFQSTSTGAITTNQWYYVGFVKKQNSPTNATITFYINGQNAGSDTTSNSVALGLSSYVLGYDYRDLNSYFKGKFGQATIWSTELSATDVANNYSATTGNYFSPSITSSSASQSVFATQAITSVIETNTGGLASYSIAPALPAGLAIDPNTGTISGSPNGPSPTTSYTITATNAAGTSTASFSLTVTQAGVVLTAPSTVTFRQSATIQATPNGSGTVVFYANGKRIPTCQRVASSGSMVTCTWKASLHGLNKVYASFNISGITGQSNVLNVIANSRSNTR